MSRTIDDPRFGSLHDLLCYQDVHLRLAAGWASTLVADYIQKEKGELDTVPRDKLTTLLKEYRKAIPDAEKVGHLVPNSEVAAVKRHEEGLDVLAELKLMHERMQERLDIAMAVERQAAMLQPTTHKDIAESRAILMSYHKVQTELGSGPNAVSALDAQRNQQINMVVHNYGKDTEKVVDQKRGVARLLRFFDQLESLVDPPEGEIEGEIEGEDSDIDIAALLAEDGDGD